MALTVVPESKSTGQIFANQLATGLGSQVGQTIGEGIGSGLGTLASGLGQITGLSETPNKLTEEMLVKAGFTPEDARLIVNSPPTVQAKLIDAISQREPAQSQPEATAPEERAELKVNPAVKQAFDEISLERARKPEETRKSALFRQKKETPEQARLRLAEEKLGFQKSEAERKHKTEQTKEERVEQHHIDQQTQKWYDQIKDKAKADKDNVKEILEMEKLGSSGKLISPGKAAALEIAEKGLFGHGVNLWGLTSPETQEYKKRSAGFVKGAKQLFGSRVTEKEIEFFMATVPTLLNSEAGRRRIGEIYKSMARASQAEDLAMEQIIEENGGKRPANIRKLTDERANEIKNEATDEFNQLIAPMKAEKSGQPEMSDELPDPTKVKRYRDSNTGKIMVSNGKSFSPE
jgi:hypothetical protein